MRYLNSSMSLMAATLALASARMTARIVDEDAMNQQTTSLPEDHIEPGPVSRQVRRQMERQARKDART